MEPKSGIKTTEFWTAVLGTIGLAAPSVLAILGDRPWVAVVLGVAAAILPAVYVWGRAALKAESARQTNVIPDRWEPALNKALDVVEALARALPVVRAAGEAAGAAGGVTGSAAGAIGAAGGAKPEVQADGAVRG